MSQLAIIICGRGPSAYLLDSYYNGYKDTGRNVWVWAQNDMVVNLATHYFEMHRPRHHLPADTSVTCYVPPGWKKLPKDKEYPSMEHIKWVVGRGYAPLGSTLSYMIALAIFHQANDIAFPGCDLHAEREHQREKERADAQFWLGIAVNSGIRLQIPEESLLLKENYYQ
jgi:hypothetical protein